MLIWLYIMDLNISQEQEVRRILNIIMSRDPPKILNKEKETYPLFEYGYFGNTVKVWRSYNEIIESGWNGLVSMRSKKGIPRGKPEYHLPIEMLPERIKAWDEMGTPERFISFNESPPDHRLILQGEIGHYAYSRGWELLYSTLKEPMNRALDMDSKIVQGLKALTMLRTAIDPLSFMDIEHLINTFPDSAIEFSTFEVPVGNIPGRNTVIWEVRNY